MGRKNLDGSPFDEVHLQWFAEGGEAGDASSGGGAAGGGADDKGSELKADGTFLAQAPDKYKKDQKYLKDLLKHKSWGEVLDRMYSAEEKVPVIPAKLEEYEFDEVKFPDYLADEKVKEYRENLGAYIKATQDELRGMGLDKATAKKFAAFFAEKVFGQYKAAQDDMAKQREAGLKALQEEWKADFKVKEELARRAMLTFGGDEMVAAAEAGGYANSPAFLKMLHKIGAAIGEDQLVPGASGRKQPTAEEKKAASLRDRYPNSPELHKLDGSGGSGRSDAQIAKLEELKSRYKSMGAGA